MGEGSEYVEGACCHGNREPGWPGFGITDGTSEDVYVLRCWLGSTSGQEEAKVPVRLTCHAGFYSTAPLVIVCKWSFCSSSNSVKWSPYVKRRSACVENWSWAWVTAWVSSASSSFLPCSKTMLVGKSDSLDCTYCMGGQTPGPNRFQIQIPGIGSRSNSTLSLIKWLLEMYE